MEEDKALQFLSRSLSLSSLKVSSSISCPSDIMRSLSTCKNSNSCLLIVLWKKKKSLHQFHVCPFVLGSFTWHHSISSTTCLRVRARTSSRACWTRGPHTLSWSNRSTWSTWRTTATSAALYSDWGSNQQDLLHSQTSQYWFCLFQVHFSHQQSINYTHKV